MRMFPVAYSRAEGPKGLPLRVKGRPSAVVSHVSAPLKGLSRYAKLNESDPLLASILTNWIVEEDRITVRPGRKTVMTLATPAPISALVPYYGFPERLMAASGPNLFDMSGALIAGGYGSDDWHWTSFSDLGDTDYTVMCNGVDGVKVWDGVAAPASTTITPPAPETWINPLKFDKTLSYMNRLWFADSLNLAVYYLPLQQKAGDLEFIPLDAFFKHGGHVMAMYTWTIDGGAGVDDQLVIFTSNGECGIFAGVDPGSDFHMVGIFRFDSPMSKNSVINYGGDLYVFIGTGLVPMSTLIRAESEKLGKYDQNVFSEFKDLTRINSDLFGWSLILDHHSNLAICNLPAGDGKYVQMVRRMPSQIWVKLSDIPSRCWGWLDDSLYIGTDDGRVCRLSKEYLNDDGAPINADVRFAWSSYKTVGAKQFKMVKLYTITDGTPRPYVDIETDYHATDPTNWPEVTLGNPGADWNLAEWNVDYWMTPPRQVSNWQGVSGMGRVGAPRIRVSVNNCTFSLTGLDVIYETGSVM